MLVLTHWGRVTHICVSKLTITDSDNGLSPGLRQAIILTNAGIFLIGPLGTNFSEIVIEIQTFSLKKMHLKMLSGKRWSFCLGLNVIKLIYVSKRGPRTFLACLPNWDYPSSEGNTMHISTHWPWAIQWKICNDIVNAHFKENLHFNPNVTPSLFIKFQLSTGAGH